MEHCLSTEKGRDKETEQKESGQELQTDTTVKVFTKTILVITHMRALQK